jgi:hypothetical protein
MLGEARIAAQTLGTTILKNGTRISPGYIVLVGIISNRIVPRKLFPDPRKAPRIITS